MTESLSQDCLMPHPRIRELTATSRSQKANGRLGMVLALVAGGVNGGGFVLLEQYTSHMTGLISTLSFDMARGAWIAALLTLSLISAFVFGAACTAVAVRVARTARWRAEYAPCLVIEGIAIALISVRTGPWEAVLLLCFSMGLQNAVITKVSKAEIRTTHVTGLITDVGIELGRAVWKAMAGKAGFSSSQGFDPARLRLHVALVIAFVFGGVGGTLLFARLGNAAALVAATLLWVVAVPETLRSAHCAAVFAKAARSRDDV